jgi:hypothetical protein
MSIGPLRPESLLAPPARPPQVVDLVSDSDEEEEEQPLQLQVKDVRKFTIKVPEPDLMEEGGPIFCAKESDVLFIDAEEEMPLEDTRGLLSAMVAANPQRYEIADGALYDKFRRQDLIAARWLQSKSIRELQKYLRELLKAPTFRLWNPVIISNEEGVLPQQVC